MDLIAPGKQDPNGLHGAICDRFGNEPHPLPDNEPLTLASYVAGSTVEVYVEHLGLGDSMTDMPLFFNPDRYISTPLDSTYMATYRSMPSIWREKLEASDTDA